MADAEDRTWLTRALGVIERVGNRLPDPLTLFVILAAAVPFLSWIAARSGWTIIHPVTDEEVRAVNLLSEEGVRMMLTEAVPNFTGFPPLGTVLVAMIGIGVAERSGLISTLLKMIVTAVPGTLLTAAVVFAGIMSSMAADAGYVVLTPLGAVVFAGVGRHPLAGLCAAFAGVSAGFSANLLLTALDPLLAGFTESAAQLYNPEYQVEATANYYFMLASTVLLMLVGWFVSERIVEPYLGEWKRPEDVPASDVTTDLSAQERRGAWAALGGFVLSIALFAWLTVPEDGLLRDDEGGIGPFYESLITVITIVFIIPGLVYGLVAGSIRNDRAVAKMTGDTMATMGPYIVLAFAAAQFVAYFRWSNLGLMVALTGADWLKAFGVSDLVLLLGMIVVAAMINLAIGSASAKWALMAPVFVPMMMSLGLSPELAQAAYRVGDSVTNIITPLNPYFPIVLAFAQQYDKNARLGTIISAMLPFAIAFFIVWSIMFTVWYSLGIPMGPDAPLRYVE